MFLVGSFPKEELATCSDCPGAKLWPDSRLRVCRKDRRAIYMLAAAMPRQPSLCVVCSVMKARIHEHDPPWRNSHSTPDTCQNDIGTNVFARVFLFQECIWRCILRWLGKRQTNNGMRNAAPKDIYSSSLGGFAAAILPNQCRVLSSSNSRLYIPSS